MIKQSFWKNKKVLVTGGTGFIGSFVTEQLLDLGAKITITTKSGKVDNIRHIKNQISILKMDLENPNNALRAVKGHEVILHLASKVAGIQFNKDHPATMFSENIILTRNILDAAVKYNVERLLITSSACVYSRHCTIPTPEAEGFLDDPEPTNLGYGWSKRVAELMGRFYSQEYGLKIALARPYNAYGPRDDFDPLTSHVIPGIIRRVFVNENPLVVWGSGKQTRSFIYVEDFARGLLEAIEKYPICDPVNIGTQEEISIRDLAKLIVRISGKKMNIVFDSEKPDGQPRRNCDINKAKKKFGFVATTSLETGLNKTIKWYELAKSI